MMLMELGFTLSNQFFALGAEIRKVFLARGAAFSDQFFARGAAFGHFPLPFRFMINVVRHIYLMLLGMMLDNRLMLRRTGRIGI